MNLLQLLLPIYVFFQTVSSRCDCMHKIVLLHSPEDYRIISSPDYPRTYCGNLDCLWRVVAPDNTSKVYFYADNLDLRDDIDQIVFYDHKFLIESDNVTESYSCTGERLCRYASTAQYLTIRFKTGGGEIDNYGFQGTVSAREKPSYALMAAVHKYLLPLTVLAVMLLGVIVSIVCCRRTVEADYQPHYKHEHHEEIVEDGSDKLLQS
ncbi:unnamed protein product [Caenorhabditis auriculariae]|uniref:CUB domain-containing protein n=1 Tax=Caenorhabditis auriculariae TaxID=2777116 RepID=A0A8S1GUB5_9PELO|nr:unnamed protein product [Caenorhabditis auriculariae]